MHNVPISVCHDGAAQWTDIVVSEVGVAVVLVPGAIDQEEPQGGVIQVHGDQVGSDQEGELQWKCIKSPS